MNFMQKTGKFPFGADQICEDNQLYAEQAYVLLEQKRQDEAHQILLKRTSSKNI